jgi:hypothetical protein
MCIEDFKRKRAQIEEMVENNVPESVIESSKLELYTLALKRIGQDSFLASDIAKLVLGSELVKLKKIK